MSGKRKSFYQRAQKNKGQVAPYGINIDKMAVTAGLSKEKTEALKDQLRESVKADEGAGNYLLHNPEEPDKLFLAAEGVCVFHDILSSYFDSHYLSEAMECVMVKNKIDYYGKKGQKILNGMSTEQIRNSIQQYDQKGSAGVKSISHATYQVLTDELRARNSARKIF